MDVKTKRTEAEEMMKSSAASAFNQTKKSCIDCHTTRTPLWRGGPAGPGLSATHVGSDTGKQRSWLSRAWRKEEHRSVKGNIVIVILIIIIKVLPSLEFLSRQD